MAKVKYVGHGDMPPARTTVYGIEFELNKAVSVTKDSVPDDLDVDFVLNKLRNNHCFEVSEVAVKKVKDAQEGSNEE